MAAPPLKEAEEQVRVRIEKEKRVKGKIGRERAKKLSKRYNKQSCYLIQLYDPRIKAPVGVIPVRTQPTLENILKDLEELGLYPLILPQPVYVPQSFWEEYRYSKDRVGLVKGYGLLKDSSIYRFETIVVDIDSPFESVYPAWNELRKRISLNSGYQVYRTKSGRFRAYIYLLDGTKDLKRARELTAIIYAFFENKELNADGTFVYRLNHPVFYEEFPLYNYELVEDVKGRVVFFGLYRRVKKLQKELGLYTFKGKNLTEEFWGRKLLVKEEGRRECRIIKAPAFLRKLQENKLDNLELWKRAVISLSEKHSSYRYIHVIQPAIGWAKYLEFPEEVVTEFLVGLLGENKRKDIEKGWKYARELEFTVPDSVKWIGETREEWEGEVIAYLQFRREVSRQELLKEVFGNKKWLCDMIMDGLIKKGMVTASFMVHGRGRPKKVYKLAEEMRIPLRKVVGLESELTYLVREEKSQARQAVSLTQVRTSDFSLNNNSLSERAMGGGWKGEEERRGRKERNRVCDEVGEGEIGSVLDLRESFSYNRRRASFDFPSDGLEKTAEDREDCNVLVELWEEGLIDF